MMNKWLIIASIFLAFSAVSCHKKYDSGARLANDTNGQVSQTKTEAKFTPTLSNEQWAQITARKKKADELCGKYVYYPSDPCDMRDLESWEAILTDRSKVYNIVGK